MKNERSFKNLSRRIVASLMAILLLSVLFACACSGKTAEPRTARENVTVTVFNGEHYKVKGENKKTVKRGESVTYEIALDEGYELVSSFGAECAVPSFKGSYSFTQTVTVPSVNYDTTVTLVTRELETAEFKTESNVDGCEVEIQTASGYTNNGEIYSDDIVNLYAIPAEGYRFHCWSTGNYLSSGGKYLSNEKILNEFDFNSTNALYANFKSTADSARTIIYDMGNGTEIEQDCSPIVAHHYRANTLTEPDLKENGYEFPEDKMLVGWETDDGEYVGLGSRTAVSDETFITLTPVWKQYADENDFIFSDGKITDYVGDSEEVVIPNKIGGEEVTSISANAFEECAAGTYYLPNTIASVEENAFLNCTALKIFYMSDNITQISDESFRGCKNFETLHLNAYLKPRYCEDFYSSIKCDIIDKIIFDKNKKKCILFGGSSVLFGYNSLICEELLGSEYGVYNSGYNMGLCAFAFFEIVGSALNEGDIVIQAPELSASTWSGLFDISVINDERGYLFWAPYLMRVCECDLQLFSKLHINRYANFFAKLAEFNITRLKTTPCEYYDYPRVIEYDETGGATVRGDAVWKENGVEDKNFISPGVLKLETSDFYIQGAKTDIHIPLIAKGVKVFLTFPPVNRHNLLMTYKTEENLKNAADEYTEKVKSMADENVHVILNQYDTIYNGGRFCDSDYHLGYPTRDIHTKKVMNALIEELNEATEEK